MQILSLHENWPTEDKPASWIHAAEQLRAVSRLCQATAIVTPLEPLSLRYGIGHSWRFSRCVREDGFWVYRPRYGRVPMYRYYLNDLSKAISIIYTILKENISFQLIHAHYVYPTGYVGALVARCLGKPLIITAHGTDVWRLMQKEKLPTRVWNRSIKALKAASLILTVSKDVKNMLCKLGFGYKVEVICMGFSKDRFFVQDRAACKKRLGFPAEQRFLLYVGSLDEIKGADLLPLILKHVLQMGRDVSLIIVGDGPLRVPIESEFERLGLSNKVKYAGEISNNAVPIYMGAADLLLVPSRQEGRSVVTIEAMACGIPVIASRVGGLPESIFADTLDFWWNQITRWHLQKRSIRH